MSTFFAAASSPVVTGIGVGTGSSKYTELVTKYVNTLASGSKASLDDQLGAWQNIESLLFTCPSDKGNLLQQTNMNDYKRAVDAWTNSDMMKRLEQVDSRYSAASYGYVAASDNGTDNVPQQQLDVLNRFSRDDQKIIFVATDRNIPGGLVVDDNKGVSYSNLDEWKADLKRQAAAFAAPPPAAAATASLAAATAANTQDVKAAPLAASKPVAAALPTMGGAPVTGASLALQLLLQAQQHAGKSAATGLASKFGDGASNPAGSRGAAAPQATSWQAAPARSDNHLNEVA